MKNTLCLLILILATTLLWAQPGTVGTVPQIASGVSAALPATCVVGQLYFLTSGTVGLNACNTTNTWSVVGGSSGGDTVTSPNSTLSVGGTSSATTLDIALGNANTWTSTQTFPAIGCGVLNTTACVLTGYGSTSGTATLTWPAVAGTMANPIIMSNSLKMGANGSYGAGGPKLLLDNGAASAPSLAFINHTGMGFFDAGGSIGVANGGVLSMYFDDAYGGQTVTLPGGAWCWGSNAALAVVDTCLTRDSAGVIDFGTGAQGNSAGVGKAAGYISGGTTFTSSGGLDEGTLVGGATAGKFTTSTLTTGSTVITMGNSATAPHGWRCSASDITHPLDIVIGTSLSVTQCTLTVAVAITLNDVIEFSAIGY